MAVTKKETVIRIDADGDVVTGPLLIDSIKYVAGTSAKIRCDGVVGGSIIWEQNGTDDFSDHANFHCQSSIYVQLAGGAVLYLYTRR